MWWVCLILTKQREKLRSLALVQWTPWLIFQASALIWIPSSPPSLLATSPNQFCFRSSWILLTSSIIPIGYVGMRVLVGCLYFIGILTASLRGFPTALLTLLQFLGMGTSCLRVAGSPSLTPKRWYVHWQSWRHSATCTRPVGQPQDSIQF